MDDEFPSGEFPALPPEVVAALRARTFERAVHEFPSPHHWYPEPPRFNHAPLDVKITWNTA